MTKEEAREAYERKVKVRKGGKAWPTKPHSKATAYNRKKDKWREEQHD